LVCLQRGEKALLPQELHGVLDSLDRHFRDNDEARLCEAWPAILYGIVHVLLQAHRITKVHRIAATIVQHNLCTEPSFERGFNGGSLIKSCREYDPWTALRLHA
jgi:hypothetical protein